MDPQHWLWGTVYRAEWGRLEWCPPLDAPLDPQICSKSYPATGHFYSHKTKHFPSWRKEVVWCSTVTYIIPYIIKTMATQKGTVWLEVKRTKNQQKKSRPNNVSAKDLQLWSRAASSLVTKVWPQLQLCRGCCFLGCTAGSSHPRMAALRSKRCTASRGTISIQKTPPDVKLLRRMRQKRRILWCGGGGVQNGDPSHLPPSPMASLGCESVWGR